MGRAAVKLPTWAVQASIGQGRRGGARKHLVAQGRRQSYQLGRCKRQLAKGGGAVPENTSLPKGGGKATNLGGASVNWPRAAGRCPKTPRCPRAAAKLPTWAVQASIGQGGRCPKTPRCPRAAVKLPTWAVQASIGRGGRCPKTPP